MLTSTDKIDISPAQFLSTFYSSLTRESTLVLLSLPVFFMVLAALASLVALPTIANYFITRNLQRFDQDESLNLYAPLESLDENIYEYENSYNDPRLF